MVSSARAARCAAASLRSSRLTLVLVVVCAAATRRSSAPTRIRASGSPPWIAAQPEKHRELGEAAKVLCLDATVESHEEGLHLRVRGERLTPQRVQHREAAECSAQSLQE